jgi:hypothetical protein
MRRLFQRDRSKQYGRASGTARSIGDESAVVRSARGSTEEEKVDAGHELQNMWIRSCEQRAAPNLVQFTGGHTFSKHLKGAGWRIINDALIPILVRGPKNSVLLHPGD